MRQFRLNPRECALIVVDVQLDFCSPDGATARRNRPNTRMQALPDKINAFVKELEGSGVLFIYTQAIVDETNLAPNVRFFNEMKGVTRPTQAGSGGEELYRLDIPADAVILHKQCPDGFTSTHLKHILRQNAISTVLICGVRTEICVESLARRAFCEGFNVIVISDLVATRDHNSADEQHSLKFIDAYVGFVLDSVQVRHILS
ncbi:MAG: isochorismatase family cysteine hydrolase [Anaerolineae bacterium]